PVRRDPWGPASAADPVTEPIPICCSSAELVVEAAQGASRLGLNIDPSFDPDPLGRLEALLSSTGPAALVVARPLSAQELVRVAVGTAAKPVLVAMASADPQVQEALALGSDLGLVGVDDVAPLLAALALANAGMGFPAEFLARGLPAADRARLLGVVATKETGRAARLVRVEDGDLAIAFEDVTRTPQRLGPVGHV